MWSFKKKKKEEDYETEETGKINNVIPLVYSDYPKTNLADISSVIPGPELYLDKILDKEKRIKMLKDEIKYLESIK